MKDYCELHAMYYRGPLCLKCEELETADAQFQEAWDEENMTDEKKEPTPTKALVLNEQSISAESLISQAIERNLPVENLERLLAFAKEIKAIQAKEAFNLAMAELQAELPIIKKDKSGGKTESGQVAYKYAPLDSIVEQTKGLIQKHGFSYSANMKLIENGPTKVNATIKVIHQLGHSETSEMTVPLGQKTRVMSDTQVVAAAQTFAKRYAFCNAFGILTGDEDNDAQTNGENGSKGDKGKTHPRVASIAVEPDINEIVPGNPPVNLVGQTYEKYLANIQNAKTEQELKGYGENIRFMGRSITPSQKVSLRVAYKKRLSEITETVVQKAERIMEIKPEDMPP